MPEMAPADRGTPFAKLAGELPWPVPGEVLSSFNSSREGALRWEGVVLAAEEGTPVRAIHPGRVVFAADEAEARAARGEDVILVRAETSPEDIHGMHAANGILTARGGMTSHAAVVARGMGRSCVSGAGVPCLATQRTPGNERSNNGTSRRSHSRTTWAPASMRSGTMPA